MLKNKKGFTLVEILCVITILSILFVFTVPNFIKTLNDKKETISEIEKNMIINAAKMYDEDCSNLTSKTTCNYTTTGNETIINLKDLIDNGYINSSKLDNKCTGIIRKKENKYSIELEC